MNAITDRIAEVLKRHRLTDQETWANTGICSCGEAVRTFPPGLSLSILCHEDHMAERVAKALELTEETRPDYILASRAQALDAVQELISPGDGPWFDPPLPPQEQWDRIVRAAFPPPPMAGTDETSL